MRTPSVSIVLHVAAVATMLTAVAVPHVHAADSDVLAAQERRVNVIKAAAKTVVAIFGPGGGGGGSGVLISADGYALTNFHVTSGAGDWMKCGLNDGKLYDAVIVSIDPTGDVALIKLLGRDDFPFAPLGDSDKVSVGDWSYAMGNPFLLATDFAPTVTYGIVSGVNRYQYPAGTFLEYTDCIQIDTSINPGNSGGPLFNEDGEVIGINGRGSFEKRGRVNSGAGYAISINQIKYFMGHLKSGRIVDHATLGATVYTDDEGAIRVDYVSDQSEAFRRGLQPDDEIVSFGGRPMRSSNQFKNVLGIYPNGWTVPLTYRRDGEKSTIMVKLEPMHTRTELAGLEKQNAAKPEPKKPGQPKKPGDEKKPEGEKEPEPKPNPLQQMMQKEPAAPKEYAHMLVKKPGFTNYWFNEQIQNSLLKSFTTDDQLWHGFTGLDGIWKLTGTSEKGEKVDLRLNPKGVILKVGETVHFQDLTNNDPKDLPPKSGGLLTAMHHLRLLAQSGRDDFSDFYYLGSEKLDGSGPLVDVLMTELTGVKSAFYFDQKSQLLLGFDTALLDDKDPCEVRFTGLQTLDGRTLPESMLVRSGDLKPVTFKLTDFEEIEK